MDSYYPLGRGRNRPIEELIDKSTNVGNNSISHPFRVKSFTGAVTGETEFLIFQATRSSFKMPVRCAERLYPGIPPN
jgi:hypothetical protein